MRVTAEQIESALRCPEFGQVELFLEFEWLVPFVDDQMLVEMKAPHFSVDRIFTSQHHAELFLQELKRGEEYVKNPYPLMTPDGWQKYAPLYLPNFKNGYLKAVRGYELFKVIAERQDYNRLIINSQSFVYGDVIRNRYYDFGPDFSLSFSRGIDPRPQCAVLKARTDAEIKLFLRSQCFEEESHSMQSFENHMVVEYVGNDLYTKRPVIYRFEPVAPQVDPESFGEGQTQILCPAYLICILIYYHVTGVESNFNPQTRLALFQHTPWMLKIIQEVLKLIDPESKKIPSRYFRSHFASSNLYAFPERMSHSWLEQALLKCQDFLTYYPTEIPK